MLAPGAQTSSRNGARGAAARLLGLVSGDMLRRLSGPVVARRRLGRWREWPAGVYKRRVSRRDAAHLLIPARGSDAHTQGCGRVQTDNAVAPRVDKWFRT